MGSAPTVPTVSVVIPAYNTAGLIPATIESVLAQTYTSYEIIVVNDGSPDTPAMERALAPFRDRITYLVQEVNRGLAAARNTAIRVARGRYISLLDSDDAWEPEYLQTHVAALEADPTLAVIYADALIMGDHPHAGLTYMDTCPSRGDVTFESVLTQKCSVFVSATARREALFEVGLFDEDLRSVEDFHLWLKILAAGKRIGYQRRVLSRHLKRRGSLSANPMWMGECVLKVLERIDRTLDLTAENRAALRQRQAFFRARLELDRGKHAFFRLDTQSALEHLEQANAFFRSPRLRMVCAAMRTFPGALLRVYRLRDRLLIGADTSF